MVLRKITDGENNEQAGLTIWLLGPFLVVLVIWFYGCATAGANHHVDVVKQSQLTNYKPICMSDAPPEVVNSGEVAQNQQVWWVIYSCK
jgi:hypothetical protein